MNTFVLNCPISYAHYKLSNRNKAKKRGPISSQKVYHGNRRNIVHLVMRYNYNQINKLYSVYIGGGRPNLPLPF